MELKTYRKKGINAYLILDGAPMTKALYGEPLPGDYDKAHKSKLHTVFIDESQLEDGTYRYKQAGGADLTKSRYGWIKIEGGEITNEGEGNPPPASADFLPKLEGSDRQVSWALDIRSNAIAKHGSKLAKYVTVQTTAKWWIDNRDKLCTQS